jgi:hypothetical protein
MALSTKPADPLTAHPRADRVNYAIGMLLNAEDFADEQTYHRSRLALALLAAGGSGTVRGLEVRIDPETADSPQRVRVTSGLAVDQLGRLIELKFDVCLRLREWWDHYAQRQPDALAEAFDAAANAVIADVFLQFAPCERGLTPAFATGPFDALNAVQAARLRDAHRVSLEPRRTAITNDPRFAPDPWQAIGADVLHDALLAVSSLTAPTPADLTDAVRATLSTAMQAMKTRILQTPAPVKDFTGLAEGVDPYGLFLARVAIPATAGSPPSRAVGTIAVDNLARAFVMPGGLIAHALGLTRQP